MKEHHIARLVLATVVAIVVPMIVVLWRAMFCADVCH
jgi:hypothetical protein